MSVIISPQWPLAEKVNVLTTTRMGGVSVAPFNEFNLADHVGDDAEAVASNRNQLVQNLHLPTSPVWLKQTHSTRVVDAAIAVGKDIEADALYTQQAKTVCAIMTADCLPLVLSDDEGECIAVVHAGWRGLVNGVIENTVAAMGSHCRPTLAWLGPAIGPQAFEVKQDVYQAYVNKSISFQACFKPRSQQAWDLDIYAAARIVLSNCSIEHVYGGDLCTYTDAERFFSYRRDGVTGRQATLAWKNK